MTSVTVSKKGQECIASGVVLADPRDPFEITIADGDERLILRCRFEEDVPGEPGITFHGVDKETAQVTFANLAQIPSLPVSFGPLAVATFKDRGMSLIFHVTHSGATVEVLYSFWVRID